MNRWLMACLALSGTLLYVQDDWWGMAGVASLSPLMGWGIMAVLQAAGSAWRQRWTRRRPEWDWPTTLEARNGPASPGAPFQSLMG